MRVAEVLIWQHKRAGLVVFDPTPSCLNWIVVEARHLAGLFYSSNTNIVNRPRPFGQYLGHPLY